MPGWGQCQWKQLRRARTPWQKKNRPHWRANSQPGAAEEWWERAHFPRWPNGIRSKSPVGLFYWLKALFRTWARPAKLVPMAHWRVLGWVILRTEWGDSWRNCPGRPDWKKPQLKTANATALLNVREQTFLAPVNKKNCGPLITASEWDKIGKKLKKEVVSGDTIFTSFYMRNISSSSPVKRIFFQKVNS